MKVYDIVYEDNIRDFLMKVNELAEQGFIRDRFIFISKRPGFNKQFIMLMVKEKRY